MAQSNDTAEPRRILRMLPAVTGPVPGNAGQARVTGPVTEPVTPPGVTGNGAGAVTGSPASNTPAAPADLETLAGGVPLSLTERVRLWAGTAARIAGEIWAPSARALRRLSHPEPETMAQHRAYIGSRAWVPPELTGKPAAVIAWAGFAYHLLIGHPLKAAAKAGRNAMENIDQAAERPLRIFMSAVFISALVLILLNT